ncbi:hypothetical protein [Streptomyces sp. NPDC012616]|uniref:hypothetical protein n=1 Tax=Streptomyces sp. NPDC012616 TaxID=3364840 RepID=UPI0036E44838
MTALPAYITADLRFPDDEIECRGDSWQRGCAAGDDGQAAYAIHKFMGKRFCGYHSPFDNTYVPCRNCGEKPALMPQTTDDHPVCDDCASTANQVTEPDPHPAATEAHPVHANRPALADLPASHYADRRTLEPSPAPGAHAPDGHPVLAAAGN